MIIYVTIIIAGIILDQLTKFWASSVLSGMTTYSIIPNVFHFTYVENTGAAFNIFSDKQIFLIIITLIFILLLGYLFFLLPKTKAFNLANLALSLMLSGAIGNLIDRMTHSYVIDFIDMRIINFAVFNVADSLVVIGACLLLYAYIKNQLVVPTRTKTKSNETQETKEEPEIKPIRKDVLKDLKPKIINRNLQPEVRTDIIQLKSVPDPTTEVKEYQPEIFFQDYSTLLDDLNKDSEISFVNENRFSEQSKHYQNSIENLIEENDRETKLKTRYNDSIESYAESVNKLREESIKETTEKETSIWHPEISNQEIQKKSYEINWNPQFDKEANKARTRFKNQIDHYAQSIKEQQNSLEETEPEEEIVEVKEETQNQSSKNRYQELTDHYLNSIEEIKNKTYTVQENQE